MKQFAWIVAFLLGLAVFMGMTVITPPRRATPDCAGQTVILKGPDGEPVECVCEAWTRSTCFNPEAVAAGPGR